MFEYSHKGLPHALMHATELVEQGGHHGATCTTVSESGHRFNLKMPAKFARTYLSRNTSQSGMLRWILERQLLVSVIARDKMLRPELTMPSTVESGGDDPEFTLRTPLNYTHGWSTISCSRGRTPATWGRTFLSKDVLITRDELISLLRVKLNLSREWADTRNLITKLRWETFGSIYCENPRTTIVGVSKSSPDRRDFVRLNGQEFNTVLSAQVSL